MIYKRIAPLVPAILLILTALTSCGVPAPIHSPPPDLADLETFVIPIEAFDIKKGTAYDYWGLIKNDDELAADIIEELPKYTYLLAEVEGGGFFETFALSSSVNNFDMGKGAWEAVNVEGTGIWYVELNDYKAVTGTWVNIFVLVDSDETSLARVWLANELPLN
jgi:hypothetical protein